MEAYNLTLDPYELRNVYTEMKPKDVEDYNALLRNFQGCYGRSCWL